MSISSMSELDNKKGENVKVAIRMRPLNRLETRTSQKEAWLINGESILQSYFPNESKIPSLSDKSKHKDPFSASYDIMFTPENDNEYVFDRLALPVVDSAMIGYHACIFAYGQTSSGKTHTIHGSAKQPGMIPLSIQYIFQFIENCIDREFVLRVSYLEIYNEIVNDLLAPENTNLRIREDVRTGVFIQGLKEDVAMSADQVFSLLHAGTSHRHVGRTNYNDVSSRSHTIFRVVVESSPLGKAKGGVRTSVLNLVDLAGSENAVKAGSAERLKETGFINKSLLTLGHVIWKLSEGINEHIPYRDSKLTRILQSSLGGKAKVAVCCNISPSSGNLEETISTLKFASRAKTIVNQVKCNEKMDGATLLKKYREEIDRLRNELDAAKEQTKRVEEEEKVNQETRARLLQTEQEKAELEAQIDELKRRILTAKPANETSGHGTLRRPPHFQRVTSSNTISRRPSVVSAFTPDLDEPTGKNDADDILVDTPSGVIKIAADDDEKIDDINELKKRLKQLRHALLHSQETVEKLRLENSGLKEDVEEKKLLLQDYEAQFAVNNNKIDLFQSELRRVAAESQSDELSELFSTLGMNEDEWDSPLVDLDAKFAAGANHTNKPNRGSSVKDMIHRFKSMEQDLDK